MFDSEGGAGVQNKRPRWCVFFSCQGKDFHAFGKPSQIAPIRVLFFILTSPITDKREQQNNPAGIFGGSCFCVRNPRKLSTHAAKAITASVARRFVLIFGAFCFYFQRKHSAEPAAICSQSCELACSLINSGRTSSTVKLSASSSSGRLTSKRFQKSFSFSRVVCKLERHARTSSDVGSYCETSRNINTSGVLIFPEC